MRHTTSGRVKVKRRKPRDAPKVMITISGNATMPPAIPAMRRDVKISTVPRILGDVDMLAYDALDRITTRRGGVVKMRKRPLHK